MSENVTELLAEIERLRALVERLRAEIVHLRAARATTMSDPIPPVTVAEINAINERITLLADGRVATLETALDLVERETHAALQRLHARIAELEAELATMRGSIAPHPADDEPGNYTHDVPPSAPR